jgi:hypothetical protein
MISNYASSLILKGLTGKGRGNDGAIVLAARSFLALSSTEPQKNGQGVTEPSGNGYARKQIGYFYDTYGQLMGDPTDGVITNKDEIHFNEATADWPSALTYVCIYDAATSGNLLAWGALKTAITAKANTVPLIRVGELTITIE